MSHRIIISEAGQLDARGLHDLADELMKIVIAEAAPRYIQRTVDIDSQNGLSDEELIYSLNQNIDWDKDKLLSTFEREDPRLKTASLFEASRGMKAS